MPKSTSTTAEPDHTGSEREPSAAGEPRRGRGRSAARATEDTGAPAAPRAAERQERTERAERPERSERGEARPDRSERQETRPERGEARPERGERHESRPERSEARPERQEQHRPQQQSGGSRPNNGGGGGGGHQGGGGHNQGGGGGGGGGDDDYGYQGGGYGPGGKRRKKKKKKRRPGAPGGPISGGGGGGHYYGRSGIPSAVLPNDEELDREAAALEEFASSKAYKDASKNALHVTQLQRMNIGDLHKFATKDGLEDFHQLPRQELIFEILKKRAAENPVMFGEGTLEVMPEGFGFLRSPEQSYLASPDDIYVAPALIRRFGLRKGMVIEGAIRQPREGERFFALLRIDTVNGKDPKSVRTLPIFEDLTPLHPFQRFVLETEPDVIETRIIDLVTPIGRGQRGLIVAPPRTGKTVILQKITQAISKNYPEVKIIVLLIDERPEEVTDFRRNTVDEVEVIASTFDEDSSRHVQVAEMVMEKSRRYVEFGEHVVILLDSITRLARAYNANQPHSGKIMSGGIDSNALTRPKKFFGSARAIEDGGSLTILGTALVDTGSKADEVIFEEFKGTGNSELHLDRKLVDKRIWPAIDVSSSGTRREELLLDPKELELTYRLRKVLADMNVVEAMELVKSRLKKTKSNAEFLMTMNLG